MVPTLTATPKLLDALRGRGHARKVERKVEVLAERREPYKPRWVPSGRYFVPPWYPLLP